MQACLIPTSIPLLRDTSREGPHGGCVQCNCVVCIPNSGTRWLFRVGRTPARHVGLNIDGFLKDGHIRGYMTEGKN